MHRGLSVAIAALAATAVAFGQHGGFVRGGGGVAPRTYGSPSGFGNVVFPGTGTAPTIHYPFYTHPTSHAQRLGATISGYQGYAPGSRNYGRGYRGYNGVAPYAVPVVVGGFGYSYGYEQPMPPPAITLVPQQPPQVIINQYYTADAARPVVREYREGTLPETSRPSVQSYQAPIPSQPDPKRDVKKNTAADDKATIYLIAFKDGRIYAAYAYWVQEGTMHYVTTQGVHNRASIELVHRELSEQLNRERNIEFKLEEK